MIIETVRVGALEVNCYILACAPASPAVIIDPGDDEPKISRLLTKHRLHPAAVINTHGHYDHIGCDDAFGVDVYVHKEEEALLRNPQLNFSSFFAAGFRVKSPIRHLEDKSQVELAGMEFEIIHTPGHSPGGVCLLLRRPQGKILFSGDTLFCQGIGRTDFAGADPQALLKAIRQRLLVLDDDTVCYPGHGPSTSIGNERRSNPFLK